MKFFSSSQKINGISMEFDISAKTVLTPKKPIHICLYKVKN